VVFFYQVSLLNFVELYEQKADILTDYFLSYSCFDSYFHLLSESLVTTACSSTGSREPATGDTPASGLGGGANNSTTHKTSVLQNVTQDLRLCLSFDLGGKK
jgi:hypothetical protein